MIVITFGTFDLIHYGHIKILERAKALGDKLIVGISSDDFSYQKKKRYPFITNIKGKKYLNQLNLLMKYL